MKLKSSLDKYSMPKSIEQRYKTLEVLYKIRVDTYFFISFKNIENKSLTENLSETFKPIKTIKTKPNDAISNSSSAKTHCYGSHMSFNLIGSLLFKNIFFWRFIIIFYIFFQFIKSIIHNFFFLLIRCISCKLICNRFI